MDFDDEEEKREQAERLEELQQQFRKFVDDRRRRERILMDLHANGCNSVNKFLGLTRASQLSLGLTIVEINRLRGFNNIKPLDEEDSESEVEPEEPVRQAAAVDRDELATFLDERGLTQFLSEFQDAGVNTLEDMKELTRRKIRSIFDYNEAFHSKIWAAVNVLRDPQHATQAKTRAAQHKREPQARTPPKQRQPADRDLVEFLGRTGFMQYKATLTDAGINTLADLRDLTSGVAKKIGIYEIHIAKFMHHVYKLAGGQ
jgi:hypothetical protein